MFPAIELSKSGTRREELLLAPEILQKTRILRQFMYNMDEIESMELMIKKMRETKTTSTSSRPCAAAVDHQPPPHNAPQNCGAFLQVSPNCGCCLLMPAIMAAIRSSLCSSSRGVPGGDMVQAVGHAVVAGVVEHLLAAADRQRRLGGDLRGDLVHAGVQRLTAVEDAIDQTYALRLSRAQLAPVWRPARG